MRWLLFLARIAFICNIFFVLSIALRFLNFTPGQSFTGLVVILGMLMAPLVNLIFNVSFVIAYYRKKEPLGIPGFIIAFNLVSQLLQLIIIPFV